MLLGIDVVETKTISQQFKDVAKRLNNGTLPPKVWGVYWTGRLVAVYLKFEHALHRLVHIKQSLDVSQEPVFQTLDEIDIALDGTLEELVNTHRQPGKPKVS